MTKREHSVDEVLKSLSKKYDVKKSLSKKHDVKVVGKSIQVLKAIVTKDGKDVENPAYQGDLGNGSWGKVDFLKSQGYKQYFVAEFKF